MFSPLICCSFDNSFKLVLLHICENYLISAQADLSKPETIPATLVGVHTVIDCATGRPEEPIKTVSIHRGE